MQLLVMIVQALDADLLCEDLVAAGFRATRIGSVGGFLAQGNVTVLVGVEDERVEEVLAIVRTTCHTRTSYMSTAQWVSDPPHFALALPAMPLEIEVGGAIIFSFPVRRYVRFRAGQDERPDDKVYFISTSQEGAGSMNLVLAIVHKEDVDSVTEEVVKGGYRLTQISTSGGFLRRGNATLLIGVESEKVNDVLRLIQAGCKARVDPNPVDKGMPMYSATVFVLESSRFERI